jgi:hypothetical protein
MSGRTPAGTRAAVRQFAAAAKAAKRFPGIEVSTSYGTPAIKVKGKFMARLRTEAEGWLAIKCDFVDREILLQAAPHVFHLTPHYQNYPMVLVDLAAIDESALLEVIERAWRATASEKAVRDWDAQHGSAAPGKPQPRKRRTLRKKRAARRETEEHVVDPTVFPALVLVVVVAWIVFTLREPPSFWQRLDGEFDRLRNELAHGLDRRARLPIFSAETVRGK